MPEEIDPDIVAINMLRAVSESGFGIITAIQVQADALDQLIDMVQTDPVLNRPRAAATLDRLHEAKKDLDMVYGMALDATMSTWSLTELPEGLTVPISDPTAEREHRPPPDHQE